MGTKIIADFFSTCYEYIKLTTYVARFEKQRQKFAELPEESVLFFCSNPYHIGEKLNLRKVVIKPTSRAELGVLQGQRRVDLPVQMPFKSRSWGHQACV